MQANFERILSDNDILKEILRVEDEFGQNILLFIGEHSKYEEKYS